MCVLRVYVCMSVYRGVCIVNVGDMTLISQGLSLWFFDAPFMTFVSDLHCMCVVVVQMLNIKLFHLIITADLL